MKRLMIMSGLFLLVSANTTYTMDTASTTSTTTPGTVGTQGGFFGRRGMMRFTPEQREKFEKMREQQLAQGKTATQKAANYPSAQLTKEQQERIEKFKEMRKTNGNVLGHRRFGRGLPAQQTQATSDTSNLRVLKASEFKEAK